MLVTVYQVHTSQYGPLRLYCQCKDHQHCMGKVRSELVVLNRTMILYSV